MKKVISLFLTATMLGAILTGCGGSEAPASSGGGTTSSGSAASSSEVSSPVSSTPSSSTTSSENSASKVQETNKPLVIGYNSSYCIQSGEYYYCYYLVELTNPNKTKAVDRAKLCTTLKNSDGKVLRSTYEYLPTIAPNDTIYFSGYTMIKDEKPEDAHYTIEYSGDYCFPDQNTVQVARSSELNVKNTYYQESSSSFYRFTGEITNTSKYNLSRVQVMVIYRVDGKLYGGDSTYVSNLASGATKSFEFLAHKLPVDNCEYKIIAVQK